MAEVDGVKLSNQEIRDHLDHNCVSRDAERPFKIGDTVFHMRENRIVEETICAVVHVEQLPARNPPYTTEMQEGTRDYAGLSIDAFMSPSVMYTRMDVVAEKQVLYFTKFGLVIENAFATKQKLLATL